MGQVDAPHPSLDVSGIGLTDSAAQRIAWGSNYPASKGSLKEMADEARSALSCLSQSDQEWILAKTAQSLYPALAD